MSSAPFRRGSANKAPAKSLEATGKLLAGDPTSEAALRLLSESALALGLPDTAAFAYEAVREIIPEDRDNLVALGEALLAAEKPTKVVTTGEMTQRLIGEAHARVEQEPANLNHYRTLVQGYRQDGRLDDALTWVRKARGLPAGAADSSLEKQESELQTALLELRWQDCEEALVAAPDDLAARVRRDEVRAELAAFRLSEAQRTVERYLNDFAARQVLGELFLVAGHVDRAIAQFKQAQKIRRCASRL